MRWVRDTPRFLARLAERRLWLFIAASIVFWTLLWPLALVWLVLWSIDRYRALDKSPAARRERRVARLLHWYPADWRARYGNELAALLHDTLAERRGGPRLSLNVAKEGLATRLAPVEHTQMLAGACLTLCWLPLIPQGLVPAVIKLTEAPTRSWFLALYVPEPFQWPVIAGMIALGLVLLRAGLSLARVRLIPRRG